MFRRRSTSRLFGFGKSRAASKAAKEQSDRAPQPLTVEIPQYRSNVKTVEIRTEAIIELPDVDEDTPTPPPRKRPPKEQPTLVTADEFFQRLDDFHGKNDPDSFVWEHADNDDPDSVIVTATQLEVTSPGKAKVVDIPSPRSTGSCCSAQDSPKVPSLHHSRSFSTGSNYDDTTSSPRTPINAISDHVPYSVFATHVKDDFSVVYSRVDREPSQRTSLRGSKSLTFLDDETVDTVTTIRHSLLTHISDTPSFRDWDSVVV